MDVTKYSCKLKLFDLLLSLNKYSFFIVLCLISCVFSWLTNYFLTEIVVYNVLSEQYSIEQIQKISNSLKSWQYLAYVLIPVIIIIRILYTSFCLYAGSLFQEYKWGFKKIFNISLKADFIFILSQIVNFYYYLLLKDAHTLNAVNTNCLSILNWVGQENVPKWLVSALNSASVFELLYIILLVTLIHKSFKQKIVKTTVFVLLTYGVGTYLYIATMTFLYLNYM